MKKIYFGGKFSLLPDQSLPLAERLAADYRTALTGDILYARENYVISDRFLYLGPFYSEKASDGDFTSTDCSAVLSAESCSVAGCDVFVAVFGEAFSVGTVVELGWAIEWDKEIVILYREEKSSAYTIKSDYWFAIADAIARSDRVKVFSYFEDCEIVPLLRRLFIEF